VRVGETLRVDGELKMCRRGLHASRRVIDALNYAPGPVLCRVDVRGVAAQDNDKLVAGERTVIWGYDASDVLLDFARRCALDVVHYWDAPDVVLRYLRAGDESIRVAAWSAANDATRDAVRVADSDATRSAASNAAWSAARTAAGDAVSDAAWSAASNAARAIARAAASDVVLEAAGEKQNRRLARMALRGRARRVEKG